MPSLPVIFGLLGNITTGLVYLAPVKTFWRIVKNRSTEDFESIPYMSKLLNAYWWVYYGIIKPNSVLVATVNGFGAVLEIIYVLLFLVFAPKGMKARTAIVCGILDVGFPAAAILFMQLMLQRDARINAAGFMCVLFSMITYGSPLSAMKTVVTTKSVEFMPFFLSLSLFVNGGVWTVYALLTTDYFIGVPNGSGFLLGTAQLILYAMYFRRSKPSYSLEDGLEQESLIPASNQLA